MKQGGIRSKLTVLLLMCLALTCLADAGTPLMWATLLHLLVGNAIIGVAEGLLLAFLFHLSRAKCIRVMIAANYFSAWAGMFVVSYALRSPDLNLNNARLWVSGMIIITFILTCLLEWPFVYSCLRGIKNRTKKSIYGNVLVQSFSYILLFGWYWMASGKSLYTEMHIAQPSAISVPTNSVLYFISTNGNICSMGLPEGATHTIASFQCTNQGDRLFLRQSDSGTINLYARIDTGQNFNDFRCINSNMNVTAVVRDEDQHNKLSEIPHNWRPQWFVPSIGSASNSLWRFRTGFYASDGIVGRNDRTGEKLHLAFETPFAQWTIRNAYQLPNDCVIFQLGNDQICALDPTTKKVALIAKGRGDVVVIE